MAEKMGPLGGFGGCVEGLERDEGGDRNPAIAAALGRFTTTITTTAAAVASTESAS